MKHKLSTYFKLSRKFYKDNGYKISMVDLVRHYSKWHNSLVDLKTPINDRKPWITFSALAHKVFEYGSGGSTLYLLDRGCVLVSVENDRKWHAKIQCLVEEFANCELLYAEPTVNERDAIDFIYRSEFPGLEDLCFKDYVETILSYPDEWFDTILIDGRCRSEALKLAKHKISKNGVIILDNAERSRYKVGIKDLIDSGFYETKFAGPGPYVKHEFWDTRFYKRR